MQEREFDLAASVLRADASDARALCFAHRHYRDLAELFRPARELADLRLPDAPFRAAFATDFVRFVALRVTRVAVVDGLERLTEAT